nr:glutamic acid-rich protein-like [Tanacetum cinerariifolium]
MVDNLPKIVWYSAHHVATIKSWLVQKQTALGKDISNPFMAGSLPKTKWHFITVVSYKLMMFGLTKDDVVKLMLLDDADGVESLPTEEIFAELARMGYEKPPPKLTFYKAFFFAQWKFLIHTLVQCVNAKRTVWNEFSCFMASAVICLATVRKFNFSKYIFDSLDWKGFSGIETPLFATMLVQPQAIKEEEDEEDEVPVAPTPPSPTHAPSPPQDQPALPSSPPQEQPTNTFDSSMTLLNTLMETCATLSQKVAHLEQDKIAQALEILKLKRKVKKIEKTRRSKSLALKRLRKVGTSQRVESSLKLLWVLRRMHPNRGRKIAKIDTDDDIILEVNAAEPTVFDDKEVTMIIAQSLIKIKAKKQRIQQMGKRLHDEEIEQSAAREKHEKDDLKKAKVLSHEEHDCLFEEYGWVQDGTLKEPTKKRVVEETLLQDSFKKLNTVKVSRLEFTQDTPTIDPKEMSEEDVQNMLHIVLVSEFKVEALQVKYPLIDWEIHYEGSRSYWKIIRVGRITQAY